VTSPLACRDVVELVTDYLEGVLPPRLHVAVEEHLRGCDDCSTYVSQLRATVSALASTPPQPLDPEFCARLVAAFRGWSAHHESDGGAM
jgi:anti-sigma factor RsiW